MKNGMSKNFVAVVKSLGLKKMPWNKCAQGFEAANYQCFSDKEKNIWVEIYLSENPVYVLVQSKTAGYRGRFFDDADKLKQFIKSEQ